MAIQERIERSFYEKVRLRVVADGYTPDILSYTDSSSGWAQYKADLEQIMNTMGFAVEVFGQSNPEDKGYKNRARVVLITESFLPGEFGIENRVYYTDDGAGNFNAMQPTQNISHQLTIKCHIVANDTTQLRYLTNLINSTLPLRGYVPYWDAPTTGFFSEVVSYLDISSATNGILEKIYTFSVPDIIWTEDVTTGTAVPITHINLKLLAHLGLLTSEQSIWIPETSLDAGSFLLIKDGSPLMTQNDQLILVK